MSKSLRKIVSTSLAPTPIGPYSQATVAGQTLYLSGQIGLNPRSGAMMNESIQAEARQAFSNMKAVVESAGITLDSVHKLNIFITDFDDFPSINEVMQEYFVAPYPARSTVGVASLPKGARIEIEGIALLPTSN